jgi:phosphoserine phosphatase RsbU/P
MQGNDLKRLVSDQQKQIEDLKYRVDFFSSLIEVSTILSSTFDLNELISKVLETSQRVMNSEASNVMLLNQETKLLECKVALGSVSEKLVGEFTLELGQGIAGWVAKHGKSQVVADTSKDKRFFGGVDDRTGFITKSIMAAPLIAQGKVIGVAEVINRADGRSFNEEDLRLFETFCSGVAVSIQNAQMHQRLLANQRFEQQLEMASIIQQGFLPRNFSFIPKGMPFEIAARNLPASMVGGDLYDCIELRKGLLGFTIGDVSGKGVPAALYMARLISDFRFYAHQFEDPIPTMQILNKMLAERSQQGMFVTMIYLTLDIERGLLSYVNGGHIPPLLYRGDTKKINRLDGGEGIPLGIRTPTDFNEERITLQEKDTLILFSDGILDAKNSAGERFSVEKLEKIIYGKWDTAEKLVSKIIAGVRKHTGGERQFDDITIMVFRWR